MSRHTRKKPRARRAIWTRRARTRTRARTGASTTSSRRSASWRRPNRRAPERALAPADDRAPSGAAARSDHLQYELRGDLECATALADHGRVSALDLDDGQRRVVVLDAVRRDRSRLAVCVERPVDDAA